MFRVISNIEKFLGQVENAKKPPKDIQERADFMALAVKTVVKTLGKQKSTGVIRPYTYREDGDRIVIIYTQHGDTEFEDDQLVVATLVDGQRVSLFFYRWEKTKDGTQTSVHIYHKGRWEKYVVDYLLRRVAREAQTKHNERLNNNFCDVTNHSIESNFPK
jgi:hypothetical protein